MLKKALEYLVDLGKNEVLDIGNQKYSTKSLEMIREPQPCEIKTTTLTSLVDYIKSSFDFLPTKKILIHVISPSLVRVRSQLRSDAARETYMECVALTPNNIHFDRFMDTDKFNIMLQSSFVDIGDRGKLLTVSGNITENAVKNVGDDGVSQGVIIKQGVASVADIKVPNPVTLAPYRTFPEIEQPESKFVFRMESGPKAALFEADGGAWRNEAMEEIKNFLIDQLGDSQFISIIS